MIVRHHEKGWKIISHYAHGLLAGKLANKLDHSLRPRNWVDVLTGIIEHDDHMLDFDEKNYLLENGTPRDFTMAGGSPSESLQHAKRLYDYACQKSQLVALMTGRHLDFLYEGLGKEHKPMQAFINEVKKMRKTQRELYGLKPREEDALYNMVQFCDRCSLLLCQDGIPEAGRKLEINHTLGDKTYFMEVKADDRISVAPWPFERDTFKVDLEYRLIKKVVFEDNRDLQKCLQTADVRRHIFQFEK